MRQPVVHPGFHLGQVRCGIRGVPTRCALALEAASQTIVRLDIGNPGWSDFRAPGQLAGGIASGERVPARMAAGRPASVAV
ncbi:MAG TPA: hypothetical protein VFY97_02545 [Rhodanobacteraceae bacterium]|nr:hypothetical protein [Rhodanobacteraceae bacterium]